MARSGSTASAAKPQSKRDDQPQSAGFYYWEFHEQDGKGLLAVRKLEGEPFSVTRFHRNSRRPM